MTGPTEADWIEAQRLIDAGYYQVSSGHRILARWDRGDTPPSVVIQEAAPGVYSRNLQGWGAADVYLRCETKDQVTVTPEVFKAFRALGGGPPGSFFLKWNALEEGRQHHPHIRVPYETGELPSPIDAEEGDSFLVFRGDSTGAWATLYHFDTLNPETPQWVDDGRFILEPNYPRPYLGWAWVTRRRALPPNQKES